MQFTYRIVGRGGSIPQNKIRICKLWSVCSPFLDLHWKVLLTCPTEAFRDLVQEVVLWEQKSRPSPTLGKWHPPLLCCSSNIDNGDINEYFVQTFGVGVVLDVCMYVYHPQKRHQRCM